MAWSLSPLIAVGVRVDESVAFLGDVFIVAGGPSIDTALVGVVAV